MLQAARAEEPEGNALLPHSSADLPIWWGPELPDGHRSGDLLVVAAVARCLELPQEEAAQWLLEQQHPLRFLLCKQLSSTASKSAWVYLAVDRVLGRSIVLKVLDTAAAKEARLLAAVAHPNVVLVHDAGVFEGRTYIVLQWCEGRTLTDYARTHAWADVLARCIEAGRGLAWCHALGIVHGDVKPSNVLIHDERALLADFGLAGRPREFGAIAGTLAYMPPERDHGIWLPAGDVFAFARTTMVALELSASRPGHRARLPRSILDILTRALADEPDERPTMAGVLEVLESVHHSLHQSLPRLARARTDWGGIAFAAAVVGVITMSLASGYRMHELIGPGLAAATVRVDPSGSRTVRVDPSGSRTVRVDPSGSRTVSNEPDIEAAIELIQRGSALAAWEEFQQAEQHGDVKLSRALELARLAVEGAEDAPISTCDEVSRVAQLISLQVVTLAVQRGDLEGEDRARRLQRRAEAAALKSPDNPPSRPR